MTDQELLQRVHIYINETSFFYSRVVDTSKRHNLDKILELKKKICKISSLPPSKYAFHILTIQHDLKQVLPFRTYPIHYEYRQKLQSIFDNCRENLRSKKVTA